MKDLKNWEVEIDNILEKGLKNKDFSKIYNFIESLLEAQKASFLEMINAAQEIEINPKTGMPYYKDYNIGWVDGVNKTLGDLKAKLKER